MATTKTSTRNNRQKNIRGIIGFAIVNKDNPKLNILDIYDKSQIKDILLEKDEIIVNIEITVSK